MLPEAPEIHCAQEPPSGRTGAGIDVVIVAYNNESTIASALSSLADRLPGCHVYLVDHASPPTTMAVARQDADLRGLTITTEADAGNPGFGAGCNRMAAQGSGQWLLFLNPDARIQAWPWRSVREIPDRTIVGANLIDEKGCEQRHFGWNWTTWSEIQRGWLRRKPRVPDGSGFVSGAAMLIQRKTFTDLCGFDTGYFLFYEDIDLCFRAGRAGVRVCVKPDWKVEHLLGHSARTDWSAALLASLRSGQRFHAMWDGSSRAYDLFMTVDGALRATAHLGLGRRRRAKAHFAVMTAAAKSLVRRPT